MENVAQLSTTIAQLQETLLRIDTIITNLENNWHGDANRDDGGNTPSQRNQLENNVD